MEEVKEHADPDIVIMLVGNKLDLCEQRPPERKILTEKALDFARENGLLFMETSAVQDINVRDVFELLVQEIYNVKSREQPKRDEKSGRVLIHNDNDLDGKKESTCC
jgi:Rab family protein